jgi:DNA end-binding protein Ku
VLLLEAMKQAGMGGIGRFVLRGAEYFCLIRPKGDALVLETLFLAEDVRSQAEIDEAVCGHGEVKDAELKLAQAGDGEPRGTSDPAELHSQYPQRPEPDARGQADGQEIAKPEPAPETPGRRPMEALKRSVRGGKGPEAAGKQSRTKKRAASKSGSQKARQPARKSA